MWWETKQNLDPNSPEDRNGDQDGDSNTNLEDYMNSLCINLQIFLTNS